MKKVFLFFIASLSLTAFAQTTEISSQQLSSALGENAVLEPIWSADFPDPSCPEGFTAIRKFCFEPRTRTIRSCGFICTQPPRDVPPVPTHPQ